MFTDRLRTVSYAHKLCTSPLEPSGPHWAAMPDPSCEKLSHERALSLEVAGVLALVPWPLQFQKLHLILHSSAQQQHVCFLRSYEGLSASVLRIVVVRRTDLLWPEWPNSSASAVRSQGYLLHTYRRSLIPSCLLLICQSFLCTICFLNDSWHNSTTTRSPATNEFCTDTRPDCPSTSS